MNQHATEFAAFVGIDWADTQHAVGLLPASPEAGLARYEQCDLPQRSEELELGRPSSARGSAGGQWPFVWSSRVEH